MRWLQGFSTFNPVPTVDEFAPAIIRLQREAPSPLPRLVLQALLALLAFLLLWAAIGRVDIIAVAPGKLVPMTYLKVVQPPESGIVAELLVREGDHVKSGQVLVRMDRHVSEAENRQIDTDLKLKQLELRRIDSELANRTFSRQTTESPEQFAEVDAKFRARRQALRDALDAESAALSRAQQDYESAVAQEAKLAQTAPILRDQEAGWSKLVSEGFAGKLMALDKTRARVEAEGELVAQHHVVASLRAAIEQSRKKIAQIESSYRQQLAMDRVETESQRHKLAQDWDKQTHRHGLLELRAPQEGTIKDLATHTVGTVVQPGTILMTLVPDNEPVLAEVTVANLDAGFVTLGQAAKIKLSAYPFQQYGMVDGVVRHVSPDATESTDPTQRRTTQGDAGLPQALPAGYRTLVELKTPYLEVEGQRFRLSPGMQVAAEINLGTRTVLQYLLSPIRKTVQEAGRER